MLKKLTTSVLILLLAFGGMTLIVKPADSQQVNGRIVVATGVQGPASSTNTDIPTMAGAAGNAIQDPAACTLTASIMNCLTGLVRSWNADTGLSRTGAGTVAVGNGTAADTSGTLSAATISATSGVFTGNVVSANKVLLVAPFTDSNASGLQVITGLSFALGTVARNWSFHCSLTYSEATPIAGDQFGVASLTTSPTNLHAWAHVITTEGATAAQTTGDSGNITNTTPTSIVTFTPVGTGVKQAEIDGSIETAGTTATTLQFYVTNGTAADVIVIARDSYCAIY